MVTDLSDVILPLITPELVALLSIDGSGRNLTLLDLLSSETGFPPPPLPLFPIFGGVDDLFAVARRVGSLPLRGITGLPLELLPDAPFAPTSGLSFAWRPEEDTFKEVSSAGVFSHGHTFSSWSFEPKPCCRFLK